MNSCMKEQLKVAAPYISKDLVSTEAWSDIYTLAQILPSFSYALLECRLGTGTSRVDLSVPLPNPTINLPDTILIHPVWSRVQDLSQELADANSSLHQRVRQLWLEFDVDEESSKMPIPCIGLHLNQETACNFQSLLEMALKLLARRVSSHLEANLKLCFDALPAEAKIAFLGAMLSRQSDALRVIIKWIPPKQLSAYLSHIGWTGSVTKLEAIISTISDFVDHIVLSFDVGDTIFPRIGLECYFINPHRNEPRWQLFLEYLVRYGMCTPAKRDALFAWSESEQQGLTNFGKVANLIKIVYQPGIPLEAKAYLGFGQN